MLKLDFPSSNQPLRVLCLGAHSDDIEIGCAGTLLTWLAREQPLHVTWAVLSAHGERAVEARRSARALLRNAAALNIVTGEFTDGHLPAEYAGAKRFFEQLRVEGGDPDIVLTHRLEDRHQDHRTIAELTWQTFRNQLVLEYEIPKYEGDLGQPNTYVPLDARIARRKVTHLMKHFGTQRSRAWFTTQTFESLMYIRGIECRAPSGFAEAFHARKLIL
ncbi:MAG TPA: PIG-L deacetylase family protein [Burkholderiaceae bacterium]|nr:PIG-L deacetylase family protein [Burkholderiaceae bacterium]